VSLNESRSTWWAGQSRRLSESSIVLQTLRRDDRVQALRSRPLGMFLYNLRFLFLAFSAIFLSALSILVWRLGARPKMVWALAALAGCWVLDTGLTLARHGWFARKLNDWASSSHVHSEFPPLFDIYFLLDSAVILLLIALSFLLDLKLEAFALLLFANTVVYSAYSRRGGRRVVAFLFYAQLLLTFCLLPFTKITAEEPLWFFTVLYVAPLLGMFLVTVWSVLMISWLRSREHSITQRRLQLLGEIESTLSERIASPEAGRQRRKKAGEVHPQVQFDRQVREVLKSLCTLGSPFWYESAALWLVEKHQDRDEPLLLPGPAYSFPEASEYADGVPSSTGFFGRNEITLLHSVKYQANEEAAATPGLDGKTDAPAAFIPLLNRESERVGVLALYGSEGGGVPQRGESTFLTSLASIISNSIEQWEGRYWAAARAEMDKLFECELLASLWDPAAHLIKKYLMAGACMIIYRPDPARKEMHVIAWPGFSEEILKHNLYEVGKGQTGRCAQTGRPIRVDNVRRHKEKFNPELLRGMEEAHGMPIRSWMAIPIGPANRNYGVIKVVNSTFMSSWFNAEDEKLGKELALRLQVIIEKFLHTEEVVQARDRAETQSEEAKRNFERATKLQEEAEDIARQRQQDLMIITHQLQGPLASLTGAVSSLQRRPLAKDVRDSLEFVKDLIEDGIALCYGTFTSFALELKRENSFGTHNIDAPRALEKLALRLQKTNARNDLTFSFYHEPGFPVVRMDRDVFTSVLYSLIHNAMKYADEHSQVSLVCAFERGRPALKVKSKGEPIRADESEAIFERFRRGKTIERTGRHHGGVGLGLWVARELMRAVKGDLVVELPPGEPRLSVFVVILPSPG
jgi:signal transduction histidine kinase